MKPKRDPSSSREKEEILSEMSAIAQELKDYEAYADVELRTFGKDSKKGETPRRTIPDPDVAGLDRTGGIRFNPHEMQKKQAG